MQGRQDLQAWQYVPRVLDHAVEILHGGPLLVEVRKKMLEVHELVRNRHI